MFHSIPLAKITKITKVAGFIALFNFIAFLVMAFILGGDAVNGHVSDGHYYLANHGKLTEVSQGVYLYSEIHVSSMLATHTIAIALSLIMLRSRTKILPQ